jgi:hypothetical protein
MVYVAPPCTSGALFPVAATVPQVPPDPEVINALISAKLMPWK